MITNKHYLALDYDKVLAILETFVQSADAKELAAELQPETSLKAAERLLQETLDAHMLLAKYGGPSFGGLVNVNNKMYIAATGGVLSMGELLSVGSTLRAIRGLSDWYSSCEGVDTSLSAYFYTMTPQKYLEERIFTSILSEDRMADNASAELKDIRRKLRQQEMKIRDQLDRIIHSSHYSTILQDAIVTMRNGRYVVPVKREHKGDVAGIVQDTSDSGATVFIEPMSVVEANNEIRVLLGKEREEIEKILADLSDQAGAVYNETKQSYESGIYLDLVFAKAQMAYSMKAAAPLLNDTGIIDLREARHPLIDPRKVVKTNIRLGDDFDTLVITGPNTGGKTVSIKTLGLMSLMAASGMMLPVADRSKMCIFESVYADIGDEQSIEQSLSTFSSHMTNIVDILKNAGREDRRHHPLRRTESLRAGDEPCGKRLLRIRYQHPVADVQAAHRSAGPVQRVCHLGASGPVFGCRRPGQGTGVRREHPVRTGRRDPRTEPRRPRRGAGRGGPHDPGSPRGQRQGGGSQELCRGHARRRTGESESRGREDPRQGSQRSGVLHGRPRKAEERAQARRGPGPGLGRREADHPQT